MQVALQEMLTALCNDMKVLTGSNGLLLQSIDNTTSSATAQGDHPLTHTQTMHPATIINFTILYDYYIMITFLFCLFLLCSYQVVKWSSSYTAYHRISQHDTRQIIRECS